MTQRALIIAALGKQPVSISGALRCDDSRYLSEVLNSLGATVRWDGAHVEVIPGALVCAEAPLYVGNAGTAMRFASCLALVAQGELKLDGDARMRERPIGALVDGLAQLGVEGRYLAEPGYPPIALRRGARVAREVSLDISISSQYASGLLLVAPCLADGLLLRLSGKKVSLPYLTMTTEMMRRAQAQVTWHADEAVVVAAGGYQAREIAIEPDWSTAAFLLGAAELAGCSVELPGLEPPGRSLQGDAAFVSFLERLRAEQPICLNLRDTPDLIAPLAAVALFARAPTTLMGVEHARVKECDRIAVLATAFNKLGAVVRERDDGLEIEPFDRSSLRSSLARTHHGEVIELDPARDHRMAMAFGLVSLRIPNIVVRDPDCVSKSFPTFWHELDHFRAETGLVFSMTPV